MRVSYRQAASQGKASLHLPSASPRSGVVSGPNGCPPTGAPLYSGSPTDVARRCITCRREFGQGHVAEWLRNGLQNRVLRFNSGRGLQPPSRDPEGRCPWAPPARRVFGISTLDSETGLLLAVGRVGGTRAPSCRCQRAGGRVAGEFNALQSETPLL